MNELLSIVSHPSSSGYDFTDYDDCACADNDDDDDDDDDDDNDDDDDDIDDDDDDDDEYKAGRWRVPGANWHGTVTQERDFAMSISNLRSVFTF